MLAQSLPMGLMLMELWSAQTHSRLQTTLRKMQTLLKVVIVVCSFWFHDAILEGVQLLGQPFTAFQNAFRYR